MVLPFILPALIGGIGTMAAGAIAASSQRKQAQQQNIFNQQQADKQYQYDMEAMQLQRKWDLEDRQFAVDNPTVVRGEVDYEQMVASAERAGFNPLTVLRNGGSAGFSSTSQPSAPLSRQAPVRRAPQQVAGPGMGSAIGDGIMGFLNNFDPFADQKRELEQRLTEAQINSLNRGAFGPASVNKPRSFNVPSWSATARSTTSAPAVLSGRPVAPTMENPTLTNPYSVPSGISVDPTVPDAAAAENRYAEILANVFGVYTAYKDVMFNINRKREAQRKHWEPLVRGALSKQQMKNSGLTGPTTRRESGGGGGW